MSKRERERRERQRRRLIRFRDLQERGIVENWPQLNNSWTLRLFQAACILARTAARGLKTKLTSGSLIAPQLVKK